MKGIRFIAVCVLAILASVGVSRADESRRGTKLLLQNGFSARSTPLGLSDAVSISLMHYYSGSDSIVFRNNHFGGGLVDEISPATYSGGAFIEIEPIAVFNLRVEYRYLAYFGLLNSIISFPDQYVDYSDNALNDLENERTETGNGTHFRIIPTLQAEFKRVILMNQTNLEWFDVNKDGYFYEPTNDTLMKTKEFFFLNMTILGYQIAGSGDNDRMILGARYSYFRVASTGTQRQQLDGAFIWMMGDKKWFMEKPRLVVVMGTFLEDRYREREFFAGTMFNFDYTLKSF